MSSCQLLDNTQKIAKQFIPTNVLPATSTQIFNTASIPATTYTFTPATSGSYIFELTAVCGTGAITAPAGSYFGFQVVDTAPGANDYGAFLRGDSIISAVSPQTQIAFTATSTHDLTAGTAYTINMINNSVSGAGIIGCVLAFFGRTTR